MTKVGFNKILNRGKLSYHGQLSELTPEEVVMRAAKEVNSSWKYSEPVKIPGLYEVYGVGTDADVTVLVWLRKDGVHVQAACW